MEGVITQSCFIGAAGTANVPLFRVPSAHGGITLLNAWIVSDTAATITTGQINNCGTSLGTAISSTVGTLAQTSGTLAANVIKAVTISTAYQDAGSWLRWQCTAGAAGTGARLILEYKYGK
jgi:hypothetical protein